MTRHAGPQRIRPLLVLNVLLVVAISGWWGTYFWEHTPARQVYRMHLDAGRATGQSSDLSRGFDAASAAASAAVGDVALGLVALVLLATGTWAYAWRAQVWLDARTSGQAVSLGASDLESQALAANPNRNLAP